MSENCLQRLEEAMARIWFHQNVLLRQPSLLSLETMVKTRGDDPASQSCPTLPSEGETIQSAADNKSREPDYKKKRPTRLNLVACEQLFQMPPSPLVRSGRRCSHTSPSESKNQQPRGAGRRRRPTEVMRSYKSLSELENDELKGFKDLGFVFHKDALSPRMMSVLPGLQRMGKKTCPGDEWLDRGEDVGKKDRVRRPYLSEAWLINRPNSPLLNLRMLPTSAEGADMKRHLLFWAKTVASKIHQES